MIQENKKLLQAEKAQVYFTDALLFLQKNHIKFDIIFCDPPFNEGWEDKLFPQLANHLTKDGLIYFESESAIKEHGEFNVLKKRKAGNVFYHLLTYKNNESI
jgi:16S rRNA (guanine966-N2)-methyltransferase